MAMKIDLSRVPDFLPGLVWIVLPNGHIDFVNRQWTVFTGLGPDNTGGLSSTRRICRRRMDTGGQSQRLASQGKWTRGCSALTVAIADS
jgi:hypothetical protein